jgi:P27 family predicted phage terminase small subunit
MELGGQIMAGIRGRKPAPTANKRLRGNPGQRRLNDKEPKPKRGRPKCPEIVKHDPVAKKYWHWLCCELDEMGILTSADGLLMALLATDYAQLHRAMVKVTEQGEVITTTHGNVVQNPHLSIANGCRRRIRFLCSEFGLTPASRARLQVETESPESRLRLFAASRGETVNGDGNETDG